MKRLLLALMVVLFCATSGWSGVPIRVISVGDSWAQGWCGDLEKVLLTKGHPRTVYNLGLPGSTASMWAEPGALNVVKLELLQHPEIEWIIMSMGGNDLLDGYLLMGYEEETFTYIESFLRTVLDDLTTFAPNVHIYLNGYDFTNFEYCAFCILLGQTALGGNTYFQNMLFQQLDDVYTTVAADYPNVYHTNLLGTLQGANGEPNPPNYLLPTPSRYFPDDDCIHPSSDNGWVIYLRAVYNVFFAPILAPADDDDDAVDDDDTIDDDDTDDDVLNDDDAIDDDDANDDDTVDDDVVDDDDTNDDDALDDDDAADDDSDDDSGGGLVGSDDDDDSLGGCCG